MSLHYNTNFNSSNLDYYKNLFNLNDNEITKLNKIVTPNIAIPIFESNRSSKNLEFLNIHKKIKRLEKIPHALHHNKNLDNLNAIAKQFEEIVYRFTDNLDAFDANPFQPLLNQINQIKKDDLIKKNSEKFDSALYILLKEFSTILNSTSKNYSTIFSAKEQLEHCEVSP